ncbi:MAG: hypothetical protein J6U00_04640 [Ruminococcus sp.]|uniref:hypothetical protein n=1 Tax=Ruminococcus sp. TaxID=41978 RepID=UPI001B1197EA|nr:hypothetical protein [Ruminococcus sp.]MBO7473281.1 hypothetical protein [Ruminococcus sp.]
MICKEEINGKDFGEPPGSIVECAEKCRNARYGCRYHIEKMCSLTTKSSYGYRDKNKPIFVRKLTKDGTG